MQFITKKIAATLVVFTLMIVSPVEILAQINPPNNCTFPGGCCPDGLPPQFCPGCPPCVPVPLNNELILLLIAGLGLGYYCLKKRNLVFN